MYNLLKNLVLSPIFFYRLFKASGFLPGNHCRFQPTCSAYFCEAVSRYGIILGFRMGTSRLFRCRPGSLFGPDEVV